MMINVITWNHYKYIDREFEHVETQSGIALYSLKMKFCHQLEI